MIEFPSMNKVEEPKQEKMSLEQYIQYCDFCIRNNPHITPENCMDRKTGEEDIKEPFSL